MAALRKKVLLFFVLSCFGTTVAAQDKKENNHRVGLGYGIASPIGNFGDTDAGNDEAGFARSGTFRFTSYDVSVNKHLGIGVRAGARINQIDKESFLRAYNQRQPPGIHSTAVEAREPWSSAFVLTDLFVQHSIDKLDLFAKVSGGLSLNGYSATWFGDYYPAGSTNMHYRGFFSSKPVLAPAYGLAGGARYSVGNFGFGLEVGVLGMRPAFNLNSGTYDEPELKQQMSSFNTAATLSYAFSVAGPGAPAGLDEGATKLISHSVGIQLGAALPVGDYRSDRFHEPQAGFAKSGTYAALTYQAAVHPSLGLGSTLGWRHNSFAMDVFAPYAGRMVNSQARLASYESGAWETFFLTGDVYFMLPFGPITLYTKGSYGAALLQSPDLSLTLIGNADSKVTEVQWKPGRTFSAVSGYSGGFRYAIGRVGVGVEAGVLQLETKSKQLLRQETININRPMHSVNTTAMVYYKI